MASALRGQVCSAYKPGICTNGFPTNAACLGATCWQCKRHTTQTPMCLRDEVPRQFINDAGLPILAHPRPKEE